MNHRSLVTMMSAKQENRRLYIWALKLTEFDFMIEYRSWKKNGVANFLSRCHVKEEEICAAGELSARRERGGDVGVPT